MLQIAFERLDGLIPPENRYVCAGRNHREAILAALPTLGPEQFLGEPTGRDTLNAIGFGAAVLAARDPDAVIAIFTADHLIEPVAEFRRIVDQGYRLAEESPNTLVTFGIAPTGPATAYGYLELGDAVGKTARAVRQFREKPPLAAAEAFFRGARAVFVEQRHVCVAGRNAPGLHRPLRAGGVRRIAGDCGRVGYATAR